MSDVLTRDEVREVLDELAARLDAAGYRIRRWQHRAAFPDPDAIYYNDHRHSPRHRKQIEEAPEWQELREQLFSARGERCQNCRRTRLLQVHHRYYLPDRDVWDYPHSALLVLCKICHRLVHGREDEAARLLREEASFESMRRRGNELTEEELEWEIERALGLHRDPTADYDEDNPGFWYADLQLEREFTAEEAFPWGDSGTWEMEDD